ncbi:MAG: hypothetical protein EOO43_01195 [Flavobacterium sp.]|nr:MAG: hypothetical protein EOO43_01195 [Flavobacterium sp.]
MRDFILQVLPNRNKFLNEKLSYLDLKRIEDLVLKSLNINNINELRDKFEGVAFIENFTLKISGLIALEKQLKVPLISWETVNPLNFEPKLYLLNQQIEIITSEYGSFPIINKDSKIPVIICIKKDKKDIWICGFADLATLNSHTNEKYLSGAVMRENNKTAFVGFNKLNTFSSLEELKTLLS